MRNESYCLFVIERKIHFNPKCVKTSKVPLPAAAFKLQK